MEFKETELIDRFLRGNLSNEELRVFERRMQEESSFKSKVDAHRLMNEMIFTKGLSDVKEKMTKDLASTNHPWTRWFWMGIVLLLAGLGAMYILPGNQWNPNVATPKTMATPVAVDPVNTEPKASESNPKVQKPIEKPQNQSLPALPQVHPPTPTSENKHAEPVAPWEEKVTVQSPSITSPSEKKLEKSKENQDCATKTWHFNVATSPTCVGKRDGMIRIQDKESNQYALQTNGIWSSERNFTELASGIYTITIKDSQGCESTTKVEVLAETCAQSFEVIINPMVGTEIIPVRSSSKGTVRIISKNGSELATLPFSENEAPSWDGRNKAGQIVERGIYPCWIQYTDQSQEKGVVVISY